MPDDIILEDKSCPLGCPRNDEFILNARDRINNVLGEYKIVRCRSCGLMRTNPRPTIETIGIYYPDTYAPFKGTRIQMSAASEKSAQKNRRRISNMFKFNMMNMPDRAPGKLLEVGCASGSFMHSMAKKGWDVEGVEPSDVAVNNLRRFGYRVFHGSVESRPEEGSLFDIIACWMTIEHLHDPLAAFRKFHLWLKDDGWLIFSIPNAGSFEFKIFKARWYGTQVPCHLYHFTERSIQNILKKTGWKIEKIFHHRILTNIIVSLGYLLEDKGIIRRLARGMKRFPQEYGLFHFLFYPFALLLSVFGQTGRMTIWAKKSR